MERSPALLLERRLREFSREQWEQSVKEVADIGMQYLVLLATVEGGKAFFDTPLAPKAQELAYGEPIDALLSAADKYGVKFFVSTGFYGGWLTETSLTNPEIVRGRFQLMEQVTARIGHHKSFYGWYLPDEPGINPYYTDEFIKSVNMYSREGRRLVPQSKILIAPYGTRLAVSDDAYVKQLEQLDVDIIAYQDEVGCERMTPEASVQAYEKLRRAQQGPATGAVGRCGSVRLGRTSESAQQPVDSSAVRADQKTIVRRVALCGRRHDLPIPGPLQQTGQPGAQRPSRCHDALYRLCQLAQVGPSGHGQELTETCHEGVRPMQSNALVTCANARNMIAALALSVACATPGASGAQVAADGLTATASSEWGAGYGAAAAADGIANENGNYWQTVEKTDRGARWQADLGEVVPVRGITIAWACYEDKYHAPPARVVVQLSNVGGDGPWQDVLTIEADKIPADESPFESERSWDYPFPAAMPGRFVRLFFPDGDQTQAKYDGYICLGEVQIDAPGLAPQFVSIDGSFGKVEVNVTRPAWTRPLSGSR